MPLELGVFLGAKRFGDAEQNAKRCLVFDSKPFQYQKYASDIAGQDISCHDGLPNRVVAEVRNWLAGYSAEPLLSGSVVFERLERFSSELDGICEVEKHERIELSYVDYLRSVQAFVASKSDSMETGLETRWGRNILDPSLMHVREAIDGMIRSDDSFVILKKSGTGMTYMQVHGCEGEGYTLEYQEGSLSRHFECYEPVTKKSIVEIFQAFRIDDPSWKTQVRWRKKDFR
jgi:hypothetical protein